MIKGEEIGSFYQRKKCWEAKNNGGSSYIVPLCEAPCGDGSGVNNILKKSTLYGGAPRDCR
jgi:hypothetical protein